MPLSSCRFRIPINLHPSPPPGGLFRALGLPVARAVPGLRLARDRVAADLAAVLHHHLLPVALARHLELDLAVLEARLLDRRLLAVRVKMIPGQLARLELQLERRLELLAVALHGPLPR